MDSTCIRRGIALSVMQSAGVSLAEINELIRTRGRITNRWVAEALQVSPAFDPIGFHPV